MDFIDRLKDAVNTLSIPIKMRTGYLSDKETLVIYSLPGSAVITQYMDGTRDVNMNYEIAMKSKDGAKIEQTLWQVQDYLDALLDVTSKNNSFEFNGLTITSKPFINDADEQGWFVFLLDFTANLTIY
ncbi:minor capsid protein [Enterococcus italicus]